MAVSIYPPDYIVIYENVIRVNNRWTPKCPTNKGKFSIINGRVFKDKYELVGRKWKKTFRAWWHSFF